MPGRPTEDPGPGVAGWLSLGTLSLGAAMTIIDATIVNVAVPSIVEELHVSLSTAEWINTVYLLAFASLLMTMGKLSDLVGRRRLFSVGVGLFVAASMTAGLSPSGGVLLAARFVQGVGAAMILPSGLAIVNAQFTARQRGLAFGVWGSVIGGMAAVGPLLGGWLTTDLSWRWAFYVNLPLGLLTLVGVAIFVPDVRAPRVIRHIDTIGVLTSAVGLGALVFGLIEGRSYGWLKAKRSLDLGPIHVGSGGVSIIPIAFGIAAIGLGAFIVLGRARLRGHRPNLLDFSLFGEPSFRFGVVAAALVSFAQLGMVFALPLFLQGVLDYTALRTGALLVAMAGGAFLGGPVAGVLADRLGVRAVVLTGLALQGTGAVLTGLALSTGSGVHLVPFLMLYGVGLGMAAAQLSNAILLDVSQQQSGQASGAQGAFRRVGGGLGVAILGTILAATLASGTRTRLVDLPTITPAQRADVARTVEESAGAALARPCARGGLAEALHVPCASPLVGQVIRRSDDAFLSSTRVVAFGSAGALLVALLVGLRIPGGRSEVRAPDATSAGAESEERLNPLRE